MNAQEIHKRIDEVLAKHASNRTKGYLGIQTTVAEIRRDLVAALTLPTVEPAAVMVGSEHSGPDLSFLGDVRLQKTKTYEITLEREVSYRLHCWKARIDSMESGERVVVDYIRGGPMDSRAEVLKAAKQLILDLVDEGS